MALLTREGGQKIWREVVLGVLEVSNGGSIFSRPENSPPSLCKYSFMEGYQESLSTVLVLSSQRSVRSKKEINPALDLARWRLFRLWKTAGIFWLCWGLCQSLVLFRLWIGTCGGAPQIPCPLSCFLRQKHLEFDGEKRRAQVTLTHWKMAFLRILSCK